MRRPSRSSPAATPSAKRTVPPIRAQYVGFAPAGAGIEEQNLGWRNSFGSGNGDATITSGLEGAWTTTPTRWNNEYFHNLFNYEWELDEKSRRRLAVDAERRRRRRHAFPTRTIRRRSTRR